MRVGGLFYLLCFFFAPFLFGCRFKELKVVCFPFVEEDSSLEDTVLVDEDDEDEEVSSSCSRRNTVTKSPSSRKKKSEMNRGEASQTQRGR